MLDILRGTPQWVYAVFFIVTYYGVIACYKNYETKKSLLLTPAIFVAISVASLKISQGFLVPLSVYALGLLVGWLLALHFYSYHTVKRKGEELVLDGSIKVLIVYWCYFAWRYYGGYQEAMYPELANEVSLVAWSSLGAGFVNGLIVGRSLRLLRFFKSTNVPAVSSK
ncbi:MULTISPECIES: hypothetical protein [unclassified Pseudomonas]|uniref:hypothetical protein n=1 Tax=unclassified Pseudomonas TaxID=196821 RepID=UPI002AC93A4A|nr:MULTISPECIES: hypothetical protein [unclassified Pseudomonas]MEB0045403.1 hypothetical protein [Pseudomonas sp. Dout3]MEB0097021.1 hypothetical protein [Pseudomonas sp. DC1.2]WPX60545.1 hypothetical protein RHM68_07895 [Pseudomonas sp. DC1.2]